MLSGSKDGGQGRNRTADASLFRAALYHLSYLATLLARRETRRARHAEGTGMFRGTLIVTNPRTCSNERGADERRCGRGTTSDAIRGPCASGAAFPRNRRVSYDFQMRNRISRLSLLLLSLALGISAAAQQPTSGTAQQPAANPAQQSFHITPLKPVAELRREALAATPPVEHGKRAPELVEVVKLDPSIKLDIRYASTNNFMATPFYTEARAFLQRPAAEALVRANQELKTRGYGILIHDAYRPWYVTRMFWDATPDDKKIFVADPAKGSNHNRGCAVDTALYDLKTGREADMPSGYDEMSPRAYPDYTGGTVEERARRDLLRSVMEANGFTVYQYEWWHFDYQGCSQWPIMNIPFEKLATK